MAKKELYLVKDGQQVGKVTFIRGFADYEFFVPVGKVEKKYNARTLCVNSLYLDEEEIEFLHDCEVIEELEIL